MYWRNKKRQKKRSSERKSRPQRIVSGKKVRGSVHYNHNPHTRGLLLRTHTRILYFSYYIIYFSTNDRCEGTRTPCTYTRLRTKHTPFEHQPQSHRPKVLSHFQTTNFSTRLFNEPTGCQMEETDFFFCSSIKAKF